MVRLVVYPLQRDAWGS